MVERPCILSPVGSNSRLGFEFDCRIGIRTKCRQGMSEMVGMTVLPTILSNNMTNDYPINACKIWCFNGLWAAH